MEHSAPPQQLPTQDHVHVDVRSHSDSPAGSMQHFVTGAPDNRFSKFLQLLEKAEYPDSQANPLTAVSEYDHGTETTTSLMVLAPSNAAFEGWDASVFNLDAPEVRRLIACHTLRVAGSFRLDSIFEQVDQQTNSLVQTFNVDCQIAFFRPRPGTPLQLELLIHCVQEDKIVKTAMVLDTAGFAGNNGHIYEVDALFVSGG